MYERFYGFKERPFSLLPDPDFLFLSDKHRMALDLLELAIFNQAGFCVISGEIGAGKTTLIRELLNRLSDDICVGLVSNTHPSFGELLQWITAAYELDTVDGDQFEQHKCFLDFVIQQYAENKRTLLIIDEAQNLSISAMEELRMLSNVNSERDLVLQVILVGQNQLREKLTQPELEQFAQRISIDYHLEGLDEQETRDYIHHRLTRAGGSADIFCDEACRTVHRCSDGIPRLINGICDICLVYGYSDNSLVITPELVREVVEDQRNGHIRTPPEQLAKYGGDATMTAFGSTLTEDVQFSEQTNTAEHKPYMERADRLLGQVEDVQERSTPAEATAHEDLEYPAKMTINTAVSDTVPETIVGSMESRLLKDEVESTPARQPRQDFMQTDSVRLAHRHRPVVDLDQGNSNANRGSRSALLGMFMALVLLTALGAAGWLSWLAWGKTRRFPDACDRCLDAGQCKRRGPRV